MSGHDDGQADALDSLVRSAEGRDLLRLAEAAGGTPGEVARLILRGEHGGR